MPLVVCTGFEFGTTAGIVTGNAGNKLFDSQLGSPSLDTTTPRNGTYCLELNPSAGEEWLRWDDNTIGTGQTRLVLAFALRFVSSLPSGDTLLAQIDTNAGPTPNIWFRTSDDKLVVHAGGGAPGTGEVAGPTVAADTWYYIELYADCSAATHTLDWWVDGTAQTQSTTSSSASTFFSVTIGGPIGSQTYTGRYDDVVVWTDTSEITTPVGKHKVQILNVDTGTAYVLNGTAANWSTFTANGTIDSSFTVTEARDRTDEWPPTIGASADGLIQDATSTTDNVEIAMTTYTLQSGESIAGLRMLAPGWAVSGTAATFGFRSYNGTTETILQAGTVDPAFDNSTTAPAWVCKMCTLADFDTQSELDGLRFRVGYSSDAAPDIGIHAIAAELAVKEAAGDVEAPAGCPTAAGEAFQTTQHVVPDALGAGAAPQPEAEVGALGGSPTAAGSAPQPTVETTGSANAPAGDALGAGIAPQPEASIGAKPFDSFIDGLDNATPPTDIYDAGDNPTALTDFVDPEAFLAAIGEAPQPEATVAPLAANALAAGSAFVGTADIDVNAGSPTAEGAALQASVQTTTEGAAPARPVVAGSAGQTVERLRRQAFAAFVDLGAPITVEDVNAPAGVASATGSAGAATADIDAKPACPTAAGAADGQTVVTGTLANAGSPTAAGSVPQPEAEIGAKPNTPVAAGTADGQTVETGAFANAPAGLASATGTAFAASITIRPNAAVGLAAGLAGPHEAEIGAKAGSPLGAGTALQPTVLFGTQASAGLAAATGTAFPGKADIDVAAVGVPVAAGEAGAVFGLVGNPTGPGQPVTVYDPPAATTLEGGVGVIIRENEDAVEVR